MYIQHVLKGIPDLSREDADDILMRSGLCSSWWRRVKQIDPVGIAAKLTERNLNWHLNRFQDKDPVTGLAFCDDTPFISLTSGAVERDAFHARNLIYPSFVTALRFATRRFTTDPVTRTSGYIFYGYVFTLGRKAIELGEFAEEVRELHIYTDFLRYHPEGEIVAKVHVPALRLHRYEAYGPDALDELRRGRMPTVRDARTNPAYRPPERFANIRGLLT